MLLRRCLRGVFRLKWLGLLGIMVFFSEGALWKYLWLFWFFGLLEIVMTYPLFFQKLRQKIGNIISAKKYNPRSLDYFLSNCHYRLPFNGQWTVVQGGVSEEYSHSWGLSSQRYAYDFLILDHDGKSYSGSPHDVEGYYCYGEDILAPCDGVVLQIGNTSKDSMVLGSSLSDPLIHDLRGNYIIIKHAESEYSLLAHLKPDSIVVEVGQSVRQGEKIASCGNSGNTSEPNLHFQLQNEENFYDAMGLPIVFKEIIVKAQENYKNYDRRPVLDREKSTKDFISRGQRVSNP